MIVVSDASPLNYLILIDRASLLPSLFGSVVAPAAVLAELRADQAPAVVRQWIEHPPSWLSVRQPLQPLLDPRLGPGEAAAIALAEETSPSLLLIDERRGTAVARGRGLKTLGTLGVIELADAEGLVDLEWAVRELRETSFRLSPEILAGILARRAQGRKRPDAE